MSHISHCGSVRKVGRYHRHLRRKDPDLAPAVTGASMVMPDGSVALPLADGSVAIYGIAPVIAYRCWLRRACGPAIETAFSAVVDLDRCVRAAQTENDFTHSQVAAQ
jgi:hypothetical protein